jgi:hypothetical protein
LVGCPSGEKDAAMRELIVGNISSHLSFYRCSLFVPILRVSVET